MLSDSESDFETPRRKRKAFTVSAEEIEVMRFQTTEVNNPDGRKSYLITYSAVDKELFPTKVDFAKTCEEVFGGGKKVSYYAACEEVHQNGTAHYHVSIKLAKSQRWATAKRKLMEKGAVVNFSEGPSHADGMYAWAYRYVCKSDPAPHETENHPSLEQICANTSRTKAASSAKKKKLEEEGPSNAAAKSKKLGNEDVADYCRKKNIKTLDGLLADAETRRVDGDTTLSKFIFSRSAKSLGEIIDMTWRMSRAVKKMTNLSTPRLSVLQTASAKGCNTDCNGSWLEAATELLQLNGINRYVFATSLRQLLTKGRGKARNLFIKGPENSGKTFLLRPLLVLFPETFANPASTRFSWLGVDQSSVILLNDYRWHTKANGGNIEWGQLLNLLEGLECNLPQPQNHFVGDLKITSDVDIPIFGTGPDQIRWYSYHEEEARGTKHDHEDRQMAVRWHIIELTHQFNQPRDIVPCGPCFAKLAFMGSE